MNTQPRTDFVDDLTPIEPGPYPHYLIAGQQWHASINSREAREYQLSDQIAHRADDEYHIITRRDDTWRWEYSRKLRDHLYLRFHGTAGSLEAAAEQALAYRPQRHRLRYLGRGFTWYRTGNAYTALIDGHVARFHEHQAGAWHWTRTYPPAATALSLTLSISEAESEGNADTRKAAMIACVDAPQRFLHACAALVAQVCGEVSRETGLTTEGLLS